MKTGKSVLIFIMMLSCQTVYASETEIAVTQPSAMTSCQCVGTFNGPTGYRMVGEPAASEIFKSKAIEHAKELEATHISWTYEDNLLTETIVATAYKCDHSALTGKKMTRY